MRPTLGAGVGWRLPMAIVVGSVAVAIALFFALRDSESSKSEIVEPICPPVTPGCELRQKIHEHADFALFIRGKQFDFGKPEFISGEGKEKSENVHIHDPRHTVVHVHREQTTWDEFFRSLGFELTDPTIGVLPEKTCLLMPSKEKLCTTTTETFKFYMNGVRVDGVADLDIAGLSRMLISYGSESEEEVLRQVAQVTDQACIPAGVCHVRGDGSGEHGEPCAKASGQCN